jgi:pyridoxal 5'-phosphate synthase pdxT subunit
LCKRRRDIRIGVLALQGSFIDHIHILQRLGVTAVPVRLPEQLGKLDGLVMPGGESTTILKLMHNFNLAVPLKEMARSGIPIWGTCAGMICLAKGIYNGMKSLNVMDMVVKRNAFGSQIDSFESNLTISPLGDKPFPCIFIRAPFIERTGLQVEILARLPNGIAVSARQGKLLATAFHPEFTDDPRVHSYFLKMVGSSA